jgi:hypothetical protein
LTSSLAEMIYAYPTFRRAIQTAIDDLGDRLNDGKT